jgi:hypothetical protein
MTIDVQHALLHTVHTVIDPSRCQTCRSQLTSTRIAYVYDTPCSRQLMGCRIGEQPQKFILEVVYYMQASKFMNKNDRCTTLTPSNSININYLSISTHVDLDITKKVSK